MSKRWFSTMLPSRPGPHYMISGSRRLPGARERIDRMDYFCVHGPRTGKTTALMGLAEELTAEGRFAALHLSCKDESPWDGDARGVALRLVRAMREMASVRLPANLRPPAFEPGVDEAALLGFFSAWTRACRRPLVLFLDDVDRVEATRQKLLLEAVCAGHPRRPSSFPWSLVLCGQWDAREYAGEIVGPAAAGVLSASMELGGFSMDEVRALLGQHTADTGQPFTKQAISAMFELTAGDPWLVNALARDIVEGQRVPVTSRVTSKHVLAAKERVIRAHVVPQKWASRHRYDPSTKGITPSLFSGRSNRIPPVNDGPASIEELELIAARGASEPTNPIFEDVLGRDPSRMTLRLMPRRPRRFLLPDGRLAFRRVLRAFCVFWRRHGAAIVAAAVHPEDAPMAALTTFLEQIVEMCGKGSLEWWQNHGPTCHELHFEYTRPDGATATQRRVLDLRVQYKDQSSRYDLGLARLDRNLPRLRSTRGTLVILDVRGKIGRRPPRFEEVVTRKGHRVLVVQV